MKSDDGKNSLFFIGDVVRIEKGIAVDAAPAPDVVTVTFGANCMARIEATGEAANSFYGKRVKVTVEEV